MESSEGSTELDIHDGALIQLAVTDSDYWLRAYTWSLCDLGSQNGSWVQRGCVPGVSIPGEQGGSCKAFYDLALKVMHHDMYYVLLIISKTQGHARFKGIGSHRRIVYLGGHL